jgi:hypothetical protein
MTSANESQNWGYLANARGADHTVNRYIAGLDTVNKLNTSAFIANTSPSAPISNFWICNSGASRHITNDPSLFSHLKHCTKYIGACKKGSQLKITGKGDVKFVVTNHEGVRVILQLTNVRYAPNARCNLLSISSFVSSDLGYYTYTTQRNSMLLYRENDDKEIAHAPLHARSNVYILHITRSPDLVATAAVDFNNLV